MISTRGVARAAAVVAAMVLVASGAVFGQETAPWPTNWNNWNDPALWVTVGNPGNAGELSGTDAGSLATRICGAVGYQYRIGKFEVTAGQYTTFLNAVAKTDAHGLYNINMDRHNYAYGCNIIRSGSSGNYLYSVILDYANRPVNLVSFWDACRFINWLNNGQPIGPQGTGTTEDGAYFLNGVTNPANGTITRAPDARFVLPSEDEWYKAAYHKNDGVTGNYWDFPTCSDIHPGQDVTEATNPGNNANYYNEGWAVGDPNYLTKVGEYEKSVGPYGTFDQGGNVWEWNEAIIDSTLRGARGSAFNYTWEWMPADHRVSYDPTYELYGDVGFRVSEVPEPATLSLLALGGLLALRCRRVAPRTDRP